jgi:hypothetical protein
MTQQSFPNKVISYWVFFFFIIELISGWLKTKLNSQTKWHRRYCIIDWDKAILFLAYKIDRRYRDWIKLLPNIFINDYEPCTNHIIEIKADSKTEIQSNKKNILSDFPR